MNRTSLALACLVAVLSVSSLAAAQETGASTAAAPEGGMAAPPEGEGATPPAEGAAAGEAAEPEHAPSRLVVGAVLSPLTTTAFADSLEVNGSIGGGVFAEYTAVPNWLAIELDVRLIAAHEGADFHGELPIDLLLKKPFELSDKLEAYIGIGGTLVPILVTSDPQVLGGLATVVGGYYWLGEHFALVGEVDWNLLFGAPNVIQELGVSLGAALGF